jgi:hypothetical protein
MLGCDCGGFEMIAWTKKRVADADQRYKYFLTLAHAAHKLGDETAERDHTEAALYWLDRRNVLEDRSRDRP